MELWDFLLLNDGDGGGDGGAGKDPAADGAKDPAKDPGKDPAGEADDKKTFTQDDVNKIIQERLAKEKVKLEKDFESKVTAAKTEAEKLAKMNADQKTEYEKQKHEEELKTREGDITRRELRATALETLAEKGLPKQLADLLPYTDAEGTKKSIEAVEKTFRDAVEAAVNERLKGGNLPKNVGGQAGTTNAEISKIFAQR